MKRIGKIVSALCCLVFLMSVAARAAELDAVMNVRVDSDSVVLFLKNQGKEIDQIYLGSDEAQSYEIKEMGPVRTIILLDNSLSINQKYRDDIKTFMTDLVSTRNDGDTFTIATFAENLTYITQDSNDYLNIKTQIDGLQFENQDSYFTNVMYTVMDDIAGYEDIRYTRVVVIADGMDDEALGYTDDELNKRVQAARIPIYAIGCTGKGNEENLKRMFALSRISNGKSYLLDNITGTEIIQDMAADTNMIRIDVVPQDKSCDGTNRIVRVSYGEDFSTAEVVMPFKAAAEATLEETTAETTEAATEQETKREKETEKDKDKDEEKEDRDETQAAESEESFFKKNLIFLLIGAAAVLLAVIGIIMAVVVNVKSKKKKQPQQVAQPRRGGGAGGQRQGGGQRVSGPPAGKGKPGNDSGDHTILLRADNSIRLSLQDIDNPSKTFEHPVRDKIYIGRDTAKCQIVINYSTFVSSIHCEVVAKGGSLFVRDGGGDVIASTNGTFVNDKRVAPELPLPSGSVLRLGQVRLRVNYK